MILPLKFLQQIQFKLQIMIHSLIAGLPTVREGLNYLVPTKWWNQFYSLNKSVSNLQSINTPALTIINFVDHFLLNYQSQLIESIQQKCLYLNFHQVKINLEINQFIDWTPINPQLWKIIKKKLKEKNQIITFIDSNKKIDFKKTKQMQLIYCSKTKSQLFVGFLPRQANLISIIRQIGFEMGFIQIQRSKITFVQKSPQVSVNFHELQKYTVETVPDIFLMMFNMQRRQHDQQTTQNHPFVSNNNTMNESNEAVVGDLNTMSNNSGNPLLDEPIQNRTMSTGAQTPFSFFSEGFDLDRQYRVNQLFGTKQPEEIQQMKQKAQNILHNHKQLIVIPNKSAEAHKSYLQNLAEEILEPIIKRKTQQIQKAYQ